MLFEVVWNVALGVVLRVAMSVVLRLFERCFEVVSSVALRVV